MKQDDMKKALESIGKCGVNVAGDLVLEKNVEYEVNNVEAGGIGIQIIKGNSNPEQLEQNGNEDAKKNLSDEQLARAIENCQEYFWGNSSYAVVYCLYRDDYGKDLTQSGFERMVEMLPYTKERDYICPPGTIANAFSDNPIYKTHVSKWKEQCAMERILLLLNKLRKELEL